MAGSRNQGCSGERAIVERLGALPPFSHRPLATRRRLARIGVEVHRPAGSVLQRRGQGARQAMVVLDGRVGPKPAAGVDAGAMGPLVGGGRPGPADAPVVALTDVRLLVFGPTELGDLHEVLAGPPAPEASASTPPQHHRRLATRLPVLGRLAAPRPSVA